VTALLQRSAYAALLMLVVAGCGGSGSGSGGGSGGGGSMFPERGGGETSQPPASAQTARVVFRSGTGEACCVALDADLVPAGALLVLDDLPAGPATVTVAFFAEDFAPTVDGVPLTCATVPVGLGAPCDPTQVASPSFESDPQNVNIVPGTQTNVTDLVIRALPFVVEFSPANGAIEPSPVQFAFTVADAVTGVEADTVALELTVQVPDGPDFRTLTKRLPVTLVPCEDASEQPCSAAGNLDLEGYKASSQPAELYPGPVGVRILALNQGDPPQEVDFTYSFGVAP